MIYFIQAGENGPIKIGRADNPQERLKQLQTANPYELKMLWVENTLDTLGQSEAEYELELHQLFKLLKIRGEWFKPGEDILNYIRSSDNSYVIKMINGGVVRVNEYSDGIKIRIYDRDSLLLDKLTHHLKKIGGS